MDATMTEAPQYVPGLERQGQPVCPEDFRIFVYLCSGEVKSVRPATDVRLTAESMDVVLGELLVARYARRDVYFASRSCMSSPTLC